MDLTFVGWGYIGAFVGAGLAVLGAGLGIGKLAAAALEGSARQPEMATKLQVTMLVAAALIEGVALLAVIICLLGSFTLNSVVKNHNAAPEATAAR